MKSDIIVGLQYGDEGKGKVVLGLLEENNYDICLRFNGGPNAGHTVYYKDQKVILHQIPCGILYNKISIIGNGCVIDLAKLKLEIEALKALDIDVDSLLKISNNVHTITQKHIEEDISNDPIGSTGSGIRPVNRDKYDRKGIRIIKLKERMTEKDNVLEGYIGKCEIIDTTEYFCKLFNTNKYILCEGAQGFNLDIDFGHYPYVTSTHCVSGFINSSGIPISTVVNVYGICKIYETYVGKMEFEDTTEESFQKLRELGDEKGSTTGRARQINWLDLYRLNQAIIINSVNKLIVNKCDIMEQLGDFTLKENKKIISIGDFEKMKRHIILYLRNVIDEDDIIFSGNKDRI